MNAALGKITPASRLQKVDEIAIMDRFRSGALIMKTMSAKAAKNAFGKMIDVARAEPVTIEKHGRPVVVVISIEEFDRLTGGTASHSQAGNLQAGESSVR